MQCHLPAYIAARFQDVFIETILARAGLAAQSYEPYL
jgi:hypothetical protein